MNAYPITIEVTTNSIRQRILHALTERESMVSQYVQKALDDIDLGKLIQDAVADELPKAVRSVVSRSIENAVAPLRYNEELMKAVRDAVAAVCKTEQA